MSLLISAMRTSCFGPVLTRANAALSGRRRWRSLLGINSVLTMFDYNRKIQATGRCYHSSASIEFQHPQSKFLGFVDNLKDVLAVETIHAQVMKNAGVYDLGVGNYILSLYVKFRCFGGACRLFDEMTQRDVRTYTILISGFARCGSFTRALDCFTEMLVHGVSPNQFTLSSILRSCSSLGWVHNGREVHGWMIKNAVEFDAALKNSVLDFYIKCGELGCGRRVFELIEDGNTVAWNIMIGSYIQIGDIENAMELFRRLPAKDSATWNTVISRLMQNGFERDALKLLHEMVGFRASFNDFTFSIALNLASSLLILDMGRQIHGQLIHAQLQNNEFVRSSLIDMYSKCGKTEQASMVFKQRPKCIKNEQNHRYNREGSMTETVSWSCMIAGFMQNSMWEHAWQTFQDMLSQGIKADKFSLTSIVSASADCGMLEFGQQVHAMILKIGYALNVILCSSLVDMYSKCGSLDDAHSVFKQAEERNVVMWTSLISGFALHGQGKHAVQLFELMKDEGVLPNALTYVGILTACSHAGLIDDGLKYFKEMKEVYKIDPVLEHFTCVVDLFGRAGQLDDIKKFISENGLSHLKLVWKAFLSSCRVHKNVELGIWVAERLMQLDPFDPEPYILLSNMWATHNRWEESARLRSLMQKRAIKKDPGQAWIKVNNEVHTFMTGDKSHPEEAKIYSYLDKLIQRLKEIGYSANLEEVMQDVEEEQREMFLQSHSEKLAVVYGLINTANSMPIRVMKNLRVCTDCHNFFKHTSNLVGREIIVRDIRRFHHFKHGHCSCGDYW